MMTRRFFVLFSLLTLVAAYGTYNDTALQDSECVSKSVRHASGGHGGFRHGK